MNGFALSNGAPPEPGRSETMLRHLEFESEVVRWERTLSAAGIPHVFVKGIGFDHWLDRSSTRVARDVDILCPRSSIRPAMQCLRSLGYTRLVTEPNATTWMGPASRLPIDLHDTLKGATVPPEAVWAIVGRYGGTVEVAGLAVPVLGPPVREFVAAVHVTLAGAGDRRATADLTAASRCSPPEMWIAAAALAEVFGCRPLFEAGFAVTPELRGFASSLGFSMASAGELLADHEGRRDAIGLLPVLAARGGVERVRLGYRFLRLHAVRGRVEPTTNTEPGARSTPLLARLERPIAGGWRLARRSVHAVSAARRLHHLLRVPATRHPRGEAGPSGWETGYHPMP